MNKLSFAHFILLSLCIAVSAAYSQTESEKELYQISDGEQPQATLEVEPNTATESANPRTDQRGKRLAELRARVFREHHGEHGTYINLRGRALGKIDRTIDVGNKPLVKQEIKRYLTTIKEFVGEVEKLEIGDVTIKPTADSTPENQKAIVRFYQVIGGARVSSSSMIILGEDVREITTTFVDPEQENADPAYWLSEDIVRSHAREELIRHLGLREIEVAEFPNPKLHFSLSAADFKVFPIYTYGYSHWYIHVNAINLETHVVDRSSNALPPTDLYTVTCDEKVISSTRLDDEDCNDSVRSQVIFGEDVANGDPVCVSDLIAVPRPSECDSAKFRDYHFYTNRVESYVKTLIENSCCGSAGFQTNSSMFGVHSRSV